MRARESCLAFEIREADWRDFRRWALKLQAKAKARGRNWRSISVPRRGKEPQGYTFVWTPRAGARAYTAPANPTGR